MPLYDMPSMFVIATYIARENVGNIDFAMKNGIWGMPCYPDDVESNEDEDHARRDPDRYQLLLIGSQAQRGTHQSRHQWNRTKTNLTLALVRSAIREERTPLWPDEVAEGRVKYPYRFAIEPVGQQRWTQNCGVSSFGPELSNAMRKSACWDNKPRSVTLDRFDASMLVSHMKNP